MKTREISCSKGIQLRPRKSVYQHTQILKDQNIVISMNGKERTIDNILIERFFRTLKQSGSYFTDYQTIKELKEGIKTYECLSEFYTKVGIIKAVTEVEIN